MSDPSAILEVANCILLVDWPTADVPRALVEAGFTVFGFSPHRFSIVEVEAGQPVFRKLDSAPSEVDIVHVFRPPAELPGIIANVVLPLHAKALWLQPPLTSSEAGQIAGEHRIDFVEGIDILDSIRNLSIRKHL